jgi:hypothetical protein
VCFDRPSDAKKALKYLDGSILRPYTGRVRVQKVSFDKDLKEVDVDMERLGDGDQSPFTPSAPELCLHEAG